METIPDNFKKTRRNPQDISKYFFESEQYDPEDNIRETIYDHSRRLENNRNFGFNGSDPSEQLNLLEEEIKTRIRITKQEIFKIGELLIQATAREHQL